MIKRVALWQDKTWVAVTDPTHDELATLVAADHVPRRFVHHLRDGKERARFDFDFDTGAGLFVFKVIDPSTNKDIEHTTTMPFAGVLLDHTLVTVCHGAGDKVNRIIEGVLQGESWAGRQQPSLKLLVMAVMLELNAGYFDRINDLDNLRQKLERYRTRPSDSQISQLSELGKSLIYLKAAASGNVIAAHQLQAIAESSDYAIALTKDERYWLKSLQEEFEQARDLAEVNSEIVAQVTDAYSNVLNNSLNTTMWLLTVWSLALAVPPIISGFYGMNVKLPIIGGWRDWPVTIILSLVPVAGLLWYLHHRHALSTHTRRR